MFTFRRKYVRTNSKKMDYIGETSIQSNKAVDVYGQKGKKICFAIIILGVTRSLTVASVISLL